MLGVPAILPSVQFPKCGYFFLFSMEKRGKYGGGKLFDKSGPITRRRAARFFSLYLFLFFVI